MFENPFSSSKPRKRSNAEFIGKVLGDAERKEFEAMMGGDKDHVPEASIDTFLATALSNEEQGAYEKELKSEIVEQAKAWNMRFFGQDTFDYEIKEIPPLPEAITKEHLKLWEKLGFKLKYLPKIRMTQERGWSKDFPGWKKQPSEGRNLFEQAHRIGVSSKNRNNPHLKDLHPLDLPGAWVLADMRPKPDHKNGSREYENDQAILGVLQKLAEQGILNQEMSPESRATNIYPSLFDRPEFQKAFSELFGLDGIPGATVRLPRVIEQNVLGQGPEWDGTAMDEWAEEYLGQSRFKSGNAAHGGASYISWGADSDSRNDTGFRLQVIFPV